MAPSPYSEKARWALDLLGKSYVEDRCAPPFHRTALKRIHAKNTCPALMVQKRDTYSDSSDILEWVDKQLPAHQKLYPADAVQGPIVRDFCKRCDNKFAPEVIAFLLTFLPRSQWAETCVKGVPDDQAKKFRWMSPFLFFLLKSRLKVNPSNFKMNVKRIGQFFDSVDNLLDGGKNYLYGDRLSAADITFCSIAAACLCLPDYGGSVINFQDAPNEIRDHVKKWREQASGKFVQCLYKDWRKRRL
jgi:glutathione S-transferase